MRDRDGIYGWDVRQVIRSLGIEPVVSAPRSPWRNPFAERVIGSIRRECTDHIIPMGESHSRRAPNEFVAYYNESRTHQSLGGNAPEPREIEAVGQIVAKPVLGGLHHRYSRAARVALAAGCTSLMVLEYLFGETDPGLMIRVTCF